MATATTARHNPLSRVALITGAGSGIGAATARLYAAHGWRVVLVGRMLEKLDAVRRSMHEAEAHHCIAADLIDAAVSRSVIDQAIARYGRIDALVLAAGIGVQCAIGEHTAALIDETLRINVIAPANMIAHAWTHFAERQCGCVVLISSLASSDPFTGFLAYAASKAGLDSLARSVAIEGKLIGVTAFVLNLGCVETPLLRRLFSHSIVPSERTISADSVAQVCLDCAEGKLDAQSGQCILMRSP